MGGKARAIGRIYKGMGRALAGLPGGPWPRPDPAPDTAQVTSWQDPWHGLGHVLAGLPGPGQGTGPDPIRPLALPWRNHP